MADEQERATRPDLWGEGENTWHDMMIEQGIHDALPREERVDFYAKRQQEAREERFQRGDDLRKKTLKQLEEAGDENGDEEGFLEAYRRKRRQQLEVEQKRQKYGTLVEIQAQEFQVEVTEANPDSKVVMCLYLEEHRPSSILLECLQKLADKFKTTKFLKMIATEAVQNFPAEHAPCVMLYHKGEKMGQLPTLASFDGLKTTPKVVEWELKLGGAVESDLEGDPRIGARNKIQIRRTGFVGEGASAQKSKWRNNNSEEGHHSDDGIFDSDDPDTW